MRIIFRPTFSISRWRVVLTALLLVNFSGWIVPHGQAYILSGERWPANAPIIMHLGLGSAGGTLIDGARSYDEVAATALAIWNPYIGEGAQFQVADSAGATARDDGTNAVFFADSAYGKSLGDDILAVTFTNVDPAGARDDCDVIFNSRNHFDSYRGALRKANGQATYDLRRTALHEFGHVLGLEHVLQNARSIMTAVVTNIDTVQPDDLAGVLATYGGHAGSSPTLPPEIIGNLVASGIVGQPFNFRIQTTNFPTSYEIKGLPPGLSLDPANGYITGTPTVANPYVVTVSASNSHGTATATFPLDVQRSGYNLQPFSE